MIVAVEYPSAMNSGPFEGFLFDLRNGMELVWVSWVPFPTDPVGW